MQIESFRCRFPRYICTRTDKGVEDASGPDVVVDLYNKQTRKMSSARELLEAQKKADATQEPASASAEEETHSEGGASDNEDAQPDAERI